MSISSGVPTEPIDALVARGTDTPLDNSVLQRNVARLGGRAFGYRPGQDHMAGLFYAGNLGGLSAHLATLPLNTDDRPIIEYLSPARRPRGDVVLSATNLHASSSSCSLPQSSLVTPWRGV